MSSVRSVLTLVVVFLALPVLLGGGLAGIVHATRRNLPPQERRRKAVVAFGIVFVILLAGEILVFGMCVSALSNN
ncbi:MAG: hypothetical protein QOI56_1522 [Actinomycetota bacterium]|nr:hypothetical protein [Actinomycetota bacterium]